MNHRRPAGLALVVVVLCLVSPSPAEAHEPVSPEDYTWVSVPDGVTASDGAQGIDTTYAASMFDAGTAFAWTPDLQATLEMHVPDGVTPDSLRLEVQPLDPATLPALPAGSANGNAYRFVVSGDWEPALRLRLETPYPATDVLVLRDEHWARVQTELLSSKGAVARVPHPSAVVVAVWHPSAHSPFERRRLLAALLLPPGLFVATEIILRLKRKDLPGQTDPAT